ncbi:MAG: hypothetical protein ACOC9Q_01910 [bacterium]
MKDEVKDLPKPEDNPGMLNDAMEGDVFKDTETGELFLIKSAYDITHFDITRIYSPNAAGEPPKTASRIPIGDPRLTNFVRMVEDIGA